MSSFESALSTHAGVKDGQSIEHEHQLPITMPAQPPEQMMPGRFPNFFSRLSRKLVAQRRKMIRKLLLGTQKVTRKQLGKRRKMIKNLRRMRR
ncbi:uncharacterized protein IAS62_005001 [Cryptococcus decagattii]|uniref:Mitochondrial mRNA-processing protein COX24 C-terminal domain-containing protein n=1 Tax=Cryptococcus decagattii TaxID=1859122 RepID=A0ABZ2B1X1_9TREE